MLSLADAILAEKIDVVEAILQHGVEINYIDEYGFTPLIEATIVDNFALVKLLLSSGADPNQMDTVGGTALHWAAENNHAALCKLLLENGSNPNAYNFSGQPVLIMPLLRQQQDVKKLLMNYGADLIFSQDYINTKLLGHIFELVGTANIVDPKNNFVEVDFEGFFLEVSLGLIGDSVAQFRNHFAARKVRRYTHLMQTIVDVIYRASQLIKYQQYRVDIKKYQTTIQSLIQQEPLVIPIGYEGHAITLIKLGNILVKCDRREESRLYDNIMIYQINRPALLDANYIQHLLYEKQSAHYINNELPNLLDLQPITELKVNAQISGNCSWANVEACIPALIFLLFEQKNENIENNLTYYKNLALSFFHQWREWNKDRALQFCIQSFREAGPLRKVCKAELLAAILFQSCGGVSPVDKERAESILATIAVPECDHIIRNYIQSYCYEDYSEEGKNFLQLLRAHGYPV